MSGIKDKSSEHPREDPQLLERQLTRLLGIRKVCTLASLALVAIFLIGCSTLSLATGDVRASAELGLVLLSFMALFGAICAVTAHFGSRRLIAFKKLRETGTPGDEA